jgi:hypothetical protein
MGILEDIERRRNEIRAEMRQPRPAPVAAPVVPEPDSWGNRFTDVGVDALKGAVGLGQTAVGIGDLATGGLASKALNKVTGYDPEATKKIADGWYSNERQAANKAVADAEGFMPTVGAMVSNPSTILGGAVEMVPQLAGLYGTGRMALAKIGEKYGPETAKKLAPWVFSAGEGLQQAGSSMQQLSSDPNVGLGDAYLSSLGSGATTALIGRAGGALGAKLGLGDVDADLIARAASNGGQSLLTRVGKGMVQEGLFEEMGQSATEQMWSNLAYNNPLMSGVPEAAAQGVVLGGMMGGAMGALNRQGGAPTPTTDPATAPAPAADPNAYDITQNIITPEVHLQDHINQMLGIGAKPPSRKDATEAFKGAIDPTAIQGHWDAKEQAFVADGVPKTTTSGFEQFLYELSVDPAAEADARLARKAGEVRDSMFGWMQDEQLVNMHNMLLERDDPTSTHLREALGQEMQARQDMFEHDQGGTQTSVQERTPESFAQEIAAGKKLETPEDIQFYQNNAPAVEDALAKISQQPAPSATPQAKPAKPTPEQRADEQLQERTAAYEELTAKTELIPEKKRGVIERLINKNKIADARALMSKYVAPEVAVESPLTDEQRLAKGQVKKVTFDAEGKEVVAWNEPSAPVVEGGPRVGKIVDPTAPAPESVGKVEEYLISAVAPKKWDAVKYFHGVANGGMTPEQTLEMHSLLMKEQLQRSGRATPNRSDELKVGNQLALLTQDSDEGPSSLRATAKKFGVSHQTVKNWNENTLALIRHAASKAGISEKLALEQLGLAKNDALDVVPISDAAAAQAGLSFRKRDGVKEIRAESDEFDPTAGNTREEVTEGEEGDVTEAEAQAAEELGTTADIGVDTMDVIHAAQAYNSFAHLHRKDGGEVPNADELSTDESAAVVAAYTSWDGKSLTWLHNQFEGVVNAGYTEVSERSDEAGEDGPSGGGRSGSRQAEAESVAGSEPTWTASNPTTSAVVKTKKRRVVARPEGTADTPSVADSGRAGEAAGNDAGVNGAEGSQVRGGNDSGAVQTADGRNADNAVTKRSVAPTTRGQPAAQLEAKLKGFFNSPYFFNRAVTVVQDENDANLPAGERKVLSETPGKVQGFFYPETNKVYMIASNIPEGRELSVLLHEVGVHMGMKNLLGQNMYDRLIKQLEMWEIDAMSGDTTTEAKLISKARERVEKAKAKVAEMGEKPMSRETESEELLAYFVEEAVAMGIDPTAVKGGGTLQQWFRSLWAAVKVAIRKLGMTPEKMKAQHVVDLAYGAARMELNAAWHGTAARFRKFDHDYMGSGEGAQAYGWGTYLAQRVGIGREYWEQDVRRKAADTYDGTPIAKDDDTPRGKAIRELKRAYDWATQMVGNPVKTLDAYTKRDLMREFGYAESDPVFTEFMALDPAKIGKKQKPEGALMRVDTSIQDDELLDWDARFDQQPQAVRDALNAANDSGSMDVTVDGNTGKGIYRDLVGNMKYNNMGTDGKKAASEYLDSIGVKGIKFLDANSRGNLRATTSYPGNFALLDAIRADEYLGFDHMSEVMDALRSDGIDAMRRNYELSPELDKQFVAYLNWYNAPADQTRNIVVFNDENIQRIFTEAGAKPESRLFSIAAEDHIAKVMGKTGVSMYADLKSVLKQAAGNVKFLHTLVKDVSKTLTSAPKWLEAINGAQMRRTELEKKAEVVATQARELSSAELKDVNKFIGDSTFQGKWGYDPKFKGRTVTVDPAMAREFNKLNPKQQAIVKQVFAHGEEMNTLKREIAKKFGVSSEFFGLGKLVGPYAPLKRFGSHVGLLKSAKVLAAEAALEKNKTKANQDAVDALKSNPAEFMVSYFDTAGQARNFVRANAANYASAENFVSADREQDGRAPNYTVLEKVMGALGADKNLDPAAKKAFEKMITDMYFQSLDENNARLTGIKRLNRAGYDQDMIRSFLSQSKAEASFVANMEFGAATNKAYSEMHDQARATRDTESMNLITAHYTDMLTRVDTPIQDRLAAATTVWLLTTSLGYHVANATQTFMVALPKLAAQFGYTPSMGALINGYKVAYGVVSFDPKRLQVGIDLSKVPKGLREALERAQLMGVLDVGMEEDLSSFSRFRTGYKLIDGASGVVAAVVHKLYQIARLVEAYNRVSTVTAAYNLAVAAKMKDPAGYAVEMVTDTQGNFGRNAAPLLLKKLPKVTGQYRKYQMLMAGIYAKAFGQAFMNDDANTKALGRKTLGFMLFHASMAAGALGLPLMNLAAMAFAFMGGDDDEPADLERWMREQLGGGAAADLILKGPFSMLGLDASAKLGQQNIISIAPYTDFELDSAAGLFKTAGGIALGPTGAVAGKMADAVGLARDGEPYKAVEKAMPKGVSDVMSTFRMANEGYSMRNGDVIAGPEEFGASLAFAAVGLPAYDVKRIQWTRGQQYEIETFYKNRTSDIQRSYARAAKAGDREEMQTLREEWVSMQNGKDNVRPFFGDNRDAIKKQPLSNLLKYPQTQSKREAGYAASMSGVLDSEDDMLE